MPITPEALASVCIEQRDITNRVQIARDTGAYPNIGAVQHFEHGEFPVEYRDDYKRPLTVLCNNLTLEHRLEV